MLDHQAVGLVDVLIGCGRDEVLRCNVVHGHRVGIYALG